LRALVSAQIQSVFRQGDSLQRATINWVFQNRCVASKFRLLQSIVLTEERRSMQTEVAFHR
jgi:hypothetical protein